MSVAPELKRLRCAIISDALHRRDAQGTVFTLAPLLRQFAVWAELFGELHIVAPFIDERDVRHDHAPYPFDNVVFHSVPLAGGNTVRDKLALARTVPAWLHVMRQVEPLVDAVHLRCPSNIGGAALLAGLFRGHHRQAVYTGNWAGYAGEPRTYRAQRWLLRRLFTGPVFVYPVDDPLAPHEVETFSPSMSAHDLQQSHARRTAALSAAPPARPLTIASVGALNTNKNHGLVIDAVADLVHEGVPTILHIVGSGPEDGALRARTAQHGLATCVHFHGNLPHPQVLALLAGADLFALPSRTEGFSKAVVEALGCGALPVVTTSAANRVITGDEAYGALVPFGDRHALAQAFRHGAARLAANPALPLAGIAHAQRFTLEAWRDHLAGTLIKAWRLA
ncbi:glycosyltransferase [Gemmatimonas sp.]|uniref:glycosyltransferase n=1 Tax=Gemmatimonas sp. TaxID=1962908 RepID=UPI0025C0E687|nr:glycosyltransferase [Gemmatimonas sp.]MCA2987978.1 glycosyltransferase family 4 protein [Gemmatimonas sp.]MCA2996951.1 glycosyltransferase family 4 protein [Gemmatimonas sp.]